MTLPLFLLLLAQACSGFVANLTDKNASSVSLVYDFVNATKIYTSWAYKDSSLKNPNAYLKICNLSENYTNVLLDLRYASESGNLSESVLVLPLLVNLTNLSQSCKLFDIDTSAFKALYPAHPFLYVVNFSMPNQTIIAKKLSEMFNGSYRVGVDIDNVDKITYITVSKVFDENGREITTKAPMLFVSIVKNSTPVAEAKSAPGAPIPFNYTFVDEEKVYVNGILSLEVRTFNPCGVINESGYYILNSSTWNVNDTCIVIENVTNTFVNFANLTVDGDFSVNGSLRENVCGVLIRNAENVSLYDARVQHFRKGVCVENSRGVKIYGTHASENYESVYVKNSSVELYTIKLSSPAEEVFAEENGRVKLYDVRIPEQTRVSFEGENFALRHVENPPPDRKGYKNINQFANITKAEQNAWVYKITFHYTYPLPNNVTHVVYITKVDGTYANGTWMNLTYTDYRADKRDFSDETGKLTHGYAWIDLNFTNFSIFIPYGLNITAPVPKPVPRPTPKPTPAPSAVAGREEKAIPPKLNLTLHEYEVTVQQGETREIGFNLTNEGKSDVFNVLVKALVRKGWLSPGVHYDVVRAGETKIGKFYLTVYENEIPGVYYIPVKAILESTNTTVDVEILKVKVIPRKRVAKIDILEILPYLVLPENSKIPISVLLENTGDYDLHNLTLSFEGAEKCIEKVEGCYDLKSGNKKSLTYYLYTKKAGEKCKGVYVFRAKEGVVGVYPVIIKTRPKSLAEQIKIFPIIYII